MPPFPGSWDASRSGYGWMHQPRAERKDPASATSIQEAEVRHHSVLPRNVRDQSSLPVDILGLPRCRGYNRARVARGRIAGANGFIRTTSKTRMEAFSRALRLRLLACRPVLCVTPDIVRRGIEAAFLSRWQQEEDNLTLFWRRITFVPTCGDVAGCTSFLRFNRSPLCSAWGQQNRRLSQAA